MDQKVAGGNELLNPEAVLKEAGVGFGQRVADLGCGGMAYFTLQAGKIVGSKGRVYAVDILKSVLENVKTRVKLEGLDNVKAVWSNVEILGATKIKEASLDFALLINTLFQSKKHKEMISEAWRLLKKGGRLVIVDWRSIATPFGPALDDRVTEAEIEQIAQELGIKKEKTFEAGPYHYGFVFLK
ncbi:MAG: hypothetical protein COY66_03310 [Candidatus Kerfeldbacteria bacterium CG_4_10_14_0_8_um_filter_42_10]|uniref:Methyltransferase domain-containing protein n=1 Tax=Candidatus Kerfeldbacteria bacterium CG_4_10_14_0_8_um_filter_42_10 TaxID=2014248 RepID=A0A2M7RIX8_9BACT|nr:MAG: hypothetical protein COY66_03310 [Candidatus Kerfeldbacteria bacterium CG_4_10_14_0_8_um_filter_42_10]